MWSSLCKQAVNFTSSPTSLPFLPTQDFQYSRHMYKRDANFKKKYT